MKNDAVNSPSHYTQGGIETIDYIKAKLTKEQFEGYLLGNVIKYTSRYQYKNGMEDLKKGSWYMKRLQESGNTLPQQQQQPAKEQPEFQPNDLVMRKDGTPFSNGDKVVTVDRIDVFGRVRFKETGSFLKPKFIELAEQQASAPLTHGINALTNEAYQNAVDKGWYEEPRTFGDMIALMHSELSEALEDYRNGKRITEVWYEGNKPCGIPSELADVVIRIFDACGYYQIDLEGAIAEKMAFNSTRPKRHGGKAL